MARRLLPLLAVATVLIAAGCASNQPTPRVPTTKGVFGSYVAMGDSSAAGPGIHPVDRGSGACSRAVKNYPAVLAKLLRISTFRDVSCSGALTTDITDSRPVTSEVPGAMIDAVTADTELVTVSMGGNDDGASAGIVVSCLYGAYDPIKCATFIDTRLDSLLKTNTKRLVAGLEEIREKAPRARIVLIGYLPVLPQEGGCVMADLEPVERVAPAREAFAKIDTAFKKAAKRANVEFVSLAAASKGHMSCDGDQAWVTGMKAIPGKGALLHPNKRGMRAVAKILAKHLTSTS